MLQLLSLVAIIKITGTVSWIMGLKNYIGCAGLDPGSFFFQVHSASASLDPPVVCFTISPSYSYTRSKL